MLEKIRSSRYRSPTGTCDLRWAVKNRRTAAERLLIVPKFLRAFLQEGYFAESEYLLLRRGGKYVEFAFVGASFERFRRSSLGQSLTIKMKRMNPAHQDEGRALSNNDTSALYCDVISNNNRIRSAAASAGGNMTSAERLAWLHVLQQEHPPPTPNFHPEQPQQQQQQQQQHAHQQQAMSLTGSTIDSPLFESQLALALQRHQPQNSGEVSYLQRRQEQQLGLRQQNRPHQQLQQQQRPSSTSAIAEHLQRYGRSSSANRSSLFMGQQQLQQGQNTGGSSHSELGIPSAKSPRIDGFSPGRSNYALDDRFDHHHQSNSSSSSPRFDPRHQILMEGRAALPSMGTLNDRCNNIVVGNHNHIHANDALRSALFDAHFHREMTAALAPPPPLLPPPMLPYHPLSTIAQKDWLGGSLPTDSSGGGGILASNYPGGGGGTTRILDGNVLSSPTQQQQQQRQQFSREIAAAVSAASWLMGASTNNHVTTNRMMNADLLSRWNNHHQNHNSSSSIPAGVATNTAPLIDRSPTLAASLHPHHDDKLSLSSSPRTLDTEVQHGKKTVYVPGKVRELSQSCDKGNLSEYQCLLRQQIVLFDVTTADIQCSAQGRNKPITLGQVGVLCRHCHFLAPGMRPSGAVYFPSTLLGIYQASQNMAINHLFKTCHIISDDTRDKLFHLKEQKTTMLGGGKQFWANGARVMGVVEHDGLLRFKDGNAIPTPPQGQDLLGTRSSTIGEPKKD